MSLTAEKEDKAKDRKKIIKRTCALLQGSGGKIILHNKALTEASTEKEKPTREDLDGFWKPVEDKLDRLIDSVSKYPEYFKLEGQYSDEEIHLNVLKPFGCCSVNYNIFFRRNRSSKEPTRSDIKEMLRRGYDNNFNPTINPEVNNLQELQQKVFNYDEEVKFDECQTNEWKLWRGDQRAFVTFIKGEAFKEKIDQVGEQGGRFVAGIYDGKVKGIHCPKEPFHARARKELDKIVKKRKMIGEIKFERVKGVPEKEERHIVVISITKPGEKKDTHNLQLFSGLLFDMKMDIKKLGVEPLPFPAEKPLFGAKYQREELTKAVSSFANARGGRLLIGIDDRSGKAMGQKDDTDPSTDSSVRRDIEQMITRYINKMTWGLQQTHPKEKLGFEPQKGIHWELDFLKINTDTNIVYPLAIVVISVAGIQNSGGVFVTTPESYVTDKDAPEPRALTFPEWKERMIRMYLILVYE